MKVLLLKPIKERYYVIQPPLRLGYLASVIERDGQIGMGTIDPVVDLDVWDSDDVDFQARLGLHGSGSNSSSSLDFYEDAALAMRLLYNGSYNSLFLYDATSGANRVTFERTGNVGIGTDDPGYRLEVRDTRSNTAVAYVANDSTGADTDGLYIKLAVATPGRTP